MGAGRVDVRGMPWRRRERWVRDGRALVPLSACCCTVWVCAGGGASVGQRAPCPAAARIPSLSRRRRRPARPPSPTAASLNSHLLGRPRHHGARLILGAGLLEDQGTAGRTAGAAPLGLRHRAQRGQGEACARRREREAEKSEECASPPLHSPPLHSPFSRRAHAHAHDMLTSHPAPSIAPGGPTISAIAASAVGDVGDMKDLCSELRERERRSVKPWKRFFCGGGACCALAH